MHLHLRPWQWKDIPDLVRICNNMHIWNNLRDQMPMPYTAKDAGEWIRFTSTQQPLRNFCIEADGVVAGGIGMVLHEDVYKRNIEIGYYIDQGLWGKGYASEAVRQLSEYVFRTTDCIRLYAEVYAHNLASMAVLRKNGFHLEAILQKSIFKNNEVLDAHIWVRFREDEAITPSSDYRSDWPPPRGSTEN